MKKNNALKVIDTAKARAWRSKRNHHESQLLRDEETELRSEIRTNPLVEYQISFKSKRAVSETN